jgi:hypothetical protein
MHRRAKPAKILSAKQRPTRTSALEEETKMTASSDDSDAGDGPDYDDDIDCADYADDDEDDDEDDAVADGDLFKRDAVENADQDSGYNSDETDTPMTEGSDDCYAVESDGPGEPRRQDCDAADLDEFGEAIRKLPLGRPEPEKGGEGRTGH